MSIISCIVCNKRISSKAETCVHCGALLKGSTEEQLERAAHIEKLKKNRRLQSFSFLAILTFVAGFFLKYYHPSSNSALWEQASLYLIGAGFLGYVVLRVWIMFNKKK